MPFEYLDHTADIAVRVRGRDFEDLLRGATDALRDILVDPVSLQAEGPGERATIRLEAEDRECLLVDYLNELIFLFDTSRFLPRRIAVVRLEGVGPASLEAEVEGETFDPERHVSRTEIKAATFHGIEIRMVADGVQTDIVFDL